MTNIDVELKNITKIFPASRNDEIVYAVDDLSLNIYDGEFFALLGPSGCGKTTTLRMIAGFEYPTSGDLLIRGQSMRGVPPFHRPVNTVFQDYALFPHMTVLQNVMFGLKMEGVNRQEAEKRAREALELVQLPKAANRKPRQLSGGQQQRVALARAIVKKPAVLLLDEPLGALDLKLRKTMQYELKAMQQQLGITFVYVTHDQEEALTMADRIAVMDQGKTLQIGRPDEIYERPVTRFVADFIGETNFMPGELLARNGKTGTVRLFDGAEFQATLPPSGEVSTGDITLAIRPERIGLIPREGNVKEGEGYAVSAEEALSSLKQDTKLTILDGVVLENNYIGTDTRYTVKLGEHIHVVVRVQNFGHSYDMIYKVGEPVHLYWSLENARILAQ